MPIDDLLAQISGDKSSSATGTTTSVSRPNAALKRKPNGDLRHDGHKTAKPAPSPLSRTPPSLPNRGPPEPGSAMRKVNGSHSTSGGSGGSMAKPNNKIPSSSSSSLSVPATAARPTTNPVNGGPAKPPKKGSFAEILARGQRAQASMGHVGMIQHKKSERGPIKRDRGEDRPNRPSKGSTGGHVAKQGSFKAEQRSNGAAQRPGAKDGRNGVDERRKSVGQAQRKPANNLAAAAAVEKKVKKAASATTGYTGTARPKPGAAVQKGKAPRGGALLNAPSSRSNKSRRGGGVGGYDEDEYDEDMDDFIDYDDEEDDGQGLGGYDRAAPRYDYADSDASSDMEAGLDELDVEERRAETIARREDIEEERLERSLKMAKEERKKKALEELRASKRR